MTRINTNVASLRGLRSMNKASQMLDQSLTRLSSGLKINSGKDNPAGLIASETLRSQISSIEQSIKNSNRANNVISTADSALGEIGGLLTQVRGLVQEGLNTGALSQSEIEANQLQIDAALGAINRIAANTTFAGNKLIDGSKSFVTTIAPSDASKLSDFKINEAVLGSSGSLSLQATVTQTAQKAKVYYGGGDLTGKATLEIGGSKGNEVVFLGGSSTIANVKDAINGVSDTTGVTATRATGHTFAKDAVAASLTISGADDSFTVTADTAGAAGNEFTVTLSTTGAAAGNPTAALDADGNVVVTLSSTAANNTADNIASAIDGLEGFSATADDGATAGYANQFAAAAADNLEGGTDAAALVLSDIRSNTSAGGLSYTVAAGGNDDAVAVSVSGQAITITAGSLATLDDVVAAINADEDASALVLALGDGAGDALIGTQASQNLAADGGALVLESSGYGSDEFVNVNVLSGTFATNGVDGSATRRDIGTDIAVTINGQAALGRGLEATLRTSTVDASLVFAEASNTANATTTVTIDGGGALFQIGQEVSAAGQIGIGIEAVNTARLGGVSGKLFELGSGGGKSLVDVNRGDANGADLVNILEDSINRVSTMRGRLGAVQKNVIDTNVATLGVALENISEARSQIVDTDFAEETANMTKAQVLSQASMSVLAIANQSPSQVLSLLG